MTGQLFGPETFDFAARYILAGYVIIIVRSRFVTGLRPKTSDLLIEAVILSLINQAIARGIGLVWLSASDWRPEPGLALALEVVVLAGLLGLLLGINLSRGWNNAFFRRLSAPVVHPSERAHDFAFGANREPCLLIITYDDDTVVTGWFGERSLASSDANRSDLYLERLYMIGEDDQWLEMNPRRGGLISLTGVRTIEFLETTGERDDQR